MYMLAIVVACSVILIGCSKKEVLTSTNLIDAVSINEVYGAEFVYNGITQIASSGNDYNIRYNSIVKVGVDASELVDSIQVDSKDKTVSVTIPEIHIMDVIVDPATIEYLPSKPNLTIKQVLEACEKDAVDGAKSETLFSNSAYDNKSDIMLFDVAEENICSAIQGLIDPLIEGTDYHLDFYRIKTSYSTEVIR